MSLATRCTACGTIFRVVQDQLRVSEGWVRCGRCAEVFDAREQLFDIDREAPPPWPAAAPGAVAVQVPPPPPPPEPRPVWTSAPTPVSASVNTHARAPEPAPILPPNLQARTMREPEHTWPAPEPTVTPTSPMPEEEPPIEAVADAAVDSYPEPQWVEEDAPPPEAEAFAPNPPPPPPPAPIEDFGTDAILAPGLAEAAAATSSPAEAATAAAAPPPMPEFMRRAQQAERWRRPQVRIALGAAAALLVAGLGLQFALQFHDAIVAVQPATRPAMQALCELGGCELKPWRRIDVVGVEASALNTAGPNNQYQLSLSLRNKSGLEVATPWVELSLTDASGSTVARRTLAPSDFKGGKASLTPGAEMPLQVLLSTGEQRVSGYSVEIFHP
ncbi:zinc-ribbon and DUF3426 domain-containing protein [Paucibacter sp. R3-3]|uniref:Zinc-ribbon and DUF3426 domain-containing protein n=1 Tax=Roseateles agri TaxID=3098619 RepID=A0ABU5DDL4_9BURK|nr:zinc-ribbon and DUF3426 domain-containing protein [Paucibacter sp. R3-3]MDY0743262.1 zinc-ribbon and DUF3426 domain-containing protein [Paucibacter sp. R3-3]